MLKLILWCILFIMCWPLAIFALILYPFIWLLLLPFRLLGIGVGGALALVAAASLLIISKHHQNIRRMLSGAEPKFQLRRK